MSVTKAWFSTTLEKNEFTWQGLDRGWSNVPKPMCRCHALQNCGPVRSRTPSNNKGRRVVGTLLLALDLY